MTYDVAYRHAQALDPSALTTVTATLHAIDRAVTDCRRAGGDPDHDAAIRLLSHHLGSVADLDQAGASALRLECTAAIVAIRRSPVLPMLAARGVDYDADAKRLFHAEGRRALHRLARALGLESDRYDVRSNQAGPAISGEVTLHGDTVWAQLSLGLTRGREFLFRRVAGRGDHVGGRNHWASIDELMAPDRLAARITTALGIEPARRIAAHAAEPLLFAREGAPA